MTKDWDDLPFTERERQSAPDRSSTTGGNFNGSAPQINGISATEEFVINNQDTAAHTFTFTPRGSANDVSTFTETIPSGVACKYSGRGISKVSIDSTTASATWKRGPRGTVFPLSNPSGAPGGGVAASTQESANPGGVSSTVEVMGGCAFSFTPKKSGIVIFSLDDDGALTDGAVAAQATVKVRFGTGTAPIAGAAATGTQVGTTSIFNQNGTTGTLRVPWAVTRRISGLTLNVAIWIDISEVVGANTSSLSWQSMNFVCQEVPV